MAYSLSGSAYTRCEDSSGYGAWGVTNFFVRHDWQLTGIRFLFRMARG
jgi:hypothetical protein